VFDLPSEYLISSANIHAPRLKGKGRLTRSSRHLSSGESQVLHGSILHSIGFYTFNISFENNRQMLSFLSIYLCFKSARELNVQMKLQLTELRIRLGGISSYWLTRSQTYKSRTTLSRYNYNVNQNREGQYRELNNFLNDSFPTFQCLIFPTFPRSATRV
jgi:hypothetical protein